MWLHWNVWHYRHWNIVPMSAMSAIPVQPHFLQYTCLQYHLSNVIADKWLHSRDWHCWQLVTMPWLKRSGPWSPNIKHTPLEKQLSIVLSANTNGNWFCWSCCALQSQEAVTAYLKSKQLLPSGFARHCWPAEGTSQHFSVYTRALAWWGQSKCKQPSLVNWPGTSGISNANMSTQLLENVKPMLV